MHKNEELYLACYQTLLMYYFREIKKTELPVDYLYCNAWEPTSRIYQGCFVEKKTRFDYVNQIDMRDLGRIGIAMKFVDGKDYERLRSAMLELLDKNCEVFLFVDEFYLPYSLQYQNLHTHHSHMLTGYRYTEDGGLIFDITDNVGAQIRHQQCEESWLEEAFNRIGESYITYFELQETEHASIDHSYFVLQLKRSILDYRDDYKIFQEFIHFSDEDWKRLLNCPEELTFYSHAFGLISGSRYCFLKALMLLQSVSSEVEERITHYHQEAQVLAFLLGKAVFSKRLDQESFSRRCTTLQELDAGIVNELKSNWAQ